MLKRVLSIFLCLVIFISMGSSKSLASNISNEVLMSNISNQVNERILELNAKYQNTRIEINTQLVNKAKKTYDIKSFDDVESLEKIFYDKKHTPVIKLKSIDELEIFLDKVEEFNKTEKSEIHYINLLPSVDATRMTEINAMSTILNGSHAFSWSAAAWWHYLLLAWETLITKNVRVEYTYKWISDDKTEFVSATSATSWISGTVVARSWTQRGNATMNILSTNRPNDTLRTSVTGSYLLGIEVEVQGVTFPIGLSNTQTWVCTLKYN